MHRLILFFVFTTFFTCEIQNLPDQFITVLGTIQDAGYPHIGCVKYCCNEGFNSKDVNFVTSLGLTDLTDGKYFSKSRIPVAMGGHAIGGATRTRLPPSSDAVLSRGSPLFLAKGVETA